MARTSPASWENALTIAKGRILLALFLLSCLLLCACSTSPSNSSALHELGIGENESEASRAAFEQDYLVIPASAGSELTARARKFAQDLTAQTGIPASLYFDNEEFLVREQTRLLLIGNVQNELAQAHLHNLRRDDYLCVMEGDTLILGGKGDSATIAAIDRFTEALLPYADTEILINNDQHFTVLAEYPLSAVTLNGFSIEDYRIVYPKDESLGEMAIASLLREKIADRCGFYLDILSDDLVEERVRVITVGNCWGSSLPSAPGIYTTHSVITLFGSSNDALSDVTDAFVHLLFANENAGTASLTLTDPRPLSATVPSLLAIGGLFEESSTIESMLAISDLSAAVQTHQPAMLPISPASEHLLTTLTLSLSDYRCLMHTESDGRMLPFFYREDILTLREEATMGSIHKMSFSIRQSGTNFTVLHACVSSTEDATAVLQVSTLQDEPTIVFLEAQAALPLSQEDLDTLRGPYTIEENSLRQYAFLHLPQGYSETTMSAPASSDEPYIFTIVYPVLNP